VNFIVLGHTGFIGAPLFARLIGQGFQVLGLNSRQISVHNHNAIQSQPRTRASIFKQIAEDILPDTVIINCIWGDLSHEKKNSNSHDMYREFELDLIRSLEKLNFKSYISFGTIHEVYTSVSALTSTSKYVESKRQINDYLENSNVPFSWIRIASVFGPNDSEFRIIPRLLLNSIHNVDTELQFPNQLMNIYHIDDLIESLVIFISAPATGSYLALSSMWVELFEIKNAIRRLEEPEYILSPLSTETNFPQVINVEASSFIQFAKGYILNCTSNRKGYC
jgi:nucleoside-diphosphate-sugar epimerase